MADAPDFNQIFCLDEPQEDYDEIVLPGEESDEPPTKKIKQQESASSAGGEVSEFQKALDLMDSGFHEHGSLNHVHQESGFSKATSSEAQLENNTTCESSLDVSSEILTIPRVGDSDSESDATSFSRQSESKGAKTAAYFSNGLDASLASANDQPGTSAILSEAMPSSNEEDRFKMQLLVSNFSKDQLSRYEMYRRSAFPKAAIRKIIQQTAGCTVTPNVIIAMAGIAKVFAGEVIEEALDVRDKWKDSKEPIKPKHIHEAVRRLRLKGQMTTATSSKPKPFRKTH